MSEKAILLFYQIYQFQNPSELINDQRNFRSKA